MAMNRHQRAPRHDEPTICRAREGRNGALNLSQLAHVDWAHLDPERRRQGPDGRELSGSGGQRGVAKDPRPRHAWRDLFEQFQPFRAETVFEGSEPGCVAAWPRQTIDKAGADRIGDNHKHDRHGARRLQQRRRTRIAGSEDDIRRESHQVGCVGAEAIGTARSPSGLDLYIAADGPARLLQTLQKYSIARLSERIVGNKVMEDADAPHPLALLRARRKWPRRRRAAEQRDELAAFHHSITSSARATRVRGT